MMLFSIVGASTSFLLLLFATTLDSSSSAWIAHGRGLVQHRQQQQGSARMASTSTTTRLYQEKKVTTTSTAAAAVTTDGSSARPAASTAVGVGGSTSSTNTPPPFFLLNAFQTAECDNINRPPSLQILIRSIRELGGTGTNSDIRGRFLPHHSPKKINHDATAGSSNNISIDETKKKSTNTPQRTTTFATIAHAIANAEAAASRNGSSAGSIPLLTPFAAYCYGAAFASFLLQQQQEEFLQDDDNHQKNLVIVIGRDPRLHGIVLADAMARGMESINTYNNVNNNKNNNNKINIKVVYTGLASTPACAAMARTLQFQNNNNNNSSNDHGNTLLPVVHGAVMVTASHLPVDRNGFKFFSAKTGLVTANQVASFVGPAVDCAIYTYTNIGYKAEWFPVYQHHPHKTDGDDDDNSVMMTKTIHCSQLVDWMPIYANSLKQAICREVGSKSEHDQPLQGLNIVLNAGNGAGGFFRNVLDELGANVQGSIHCEPNADFPNGIPNPEYAPMIQQTMQACQDANADLGIMLDTDADRCGFIVKNVQTGQYEPIHRNRLIALLGVVFATQQQQHQSSSGGLATAVVTDSVTSEGLTVFLENLGLKHVRHVKGYANVINKAKELTEAGVCNAVLAIETSGHCAMKENDYLDDGTYTAVKVVGLLARTRKQQQEQVASNNDQPTSLLDLISDLQELDEVTELRIKVADGSLVTMNRIFDFCALEMEQACEATTDDSSTSLWELDTENLEGIRIRTGNGQFLMLRKSLHDPIISLQMESRSNEEAREYMVQPLLRLFEKEDLIRNAIDLTVLHNY